MTLVWIFNCQESQSIYEETSCWVLPSSDLVFGTRFPLRLARLLGSHCLFDLSHLGSLLSDPQARQMSV